MIDDSIAAPGLAHRAMAPELDLVADLMGGTTAMRRAGQRWLPREANESWTAWRARLARSVLFNGLSRTVQALAGRPFSRPVALADADETMMRLAADTDGEGTGLGSFAGMLLRALLTDGMVHILVDRPRRGGDPYFVLLRASRVIGARRDDDGLNDIRISETVARPAGRYGEEAVDAVRHIDRAGWSVQHATRSGWQKQDEGTHDFGIVPLITLNAAPLGFMRARPPLIDLAWLNLAHWQQASDQRHILHVARVPILFGRGLSEGEIDLLLANDIAIAVEACNEIFGPGFAGMAEPRRHALISMAFNMGAPRLAGFRRMRAAIATDDWAAAAAEALDSRWAAQTGRRAHDIAALLRSG